MPTETQITETAESLGAMAKRAGSSYANDVLIGGFGAFAAMWGAEAAGVMLAAAKKIADQ